MSVIIKGMKMPKHCMDCVLKNAEDDCMVQEWQEWETWEDMRKDCPIVELPEKHGRLIDADLVIEKASHEAKAMDEPLKSNFDVLVEWIVDKTPTAIEAERSE